MGRRIILPAMLRKVKRGIAEAINDRRLIKNAGIVSYSQCGEDLIVQYIFSLRAGIGDHTQAVFIGSVNQLENLRLSELLSKIIIKQTDVNKLSSAKIQGINHIDFHLMLDFSNTKLEGDGICKNNLFWNHSIVLSSI